MAIPIVDMKDLGKNFVMKQKFKNIILANLNRPRQQW